ncbi:hypothetical protein NL676_006794 [Syzygium grande]|nr:hypothetical protein NL676_006794 [Syzygium grande]
MISTCPFDSCNIDVDSLLLTYLHLHLQSHNTVMFEIAGLHGPSKLQSAILPHRWQCCEFADRLRHDPSSLNHHVADAVADAVADKAGDVAGGAAGEHGDDAALISSAASEFS